MLALCMTKLGLIPDILHDPLNLPSESLVIIPPTKKEKNSFEPSYSPDPRLEELKDPHVTAPTLVL